MEKLPLVLLLFFSSIASAQWDFLYQRPRALSSDGQFLFSLSYAASGGINLYITPVNDWKCTNNSDNASIMASIYFNGVLIKMAANCNDGVINHYPLTDDGSNYVINQLYYKNQLTLYSANNQYITTVSAVGFQKEYKKLLATPKINKGL